VENRINSSLKETKVKVGKCGNDRGVLMEIMQTRSFE
jgi:hypothetical protein